MTTLSNPLETSLPEEAPNRPPPLLAVGPLAWMRKNLFASWLDTLLTIGGSILAVGAVTSFLAWVVGQANWFVVTFNLRLLLVGRMAPDELWRVLVLALLTAFAVGVSLAAWSRVSRGLTIVLAVIIAFMFIIPPVITALIPLPPTYVAAGNGDIISGSVTETAQPQLGFIARAGETVTVRIADQYSADDVSLGSLTSFTDKAATLLGNSASNRLNTAARIEEIDALLASDLLTAGQRDRLTIERGKLEVAAPITETYVLNQGQINVRILRGPTLEPIAEGTLEAGSPTISVVLPEDGWYILDKTSTEGDTSLALLEAHNIGPILERQLTRAGEVDETTGETTSAAGRYSQYVRMTDGFTTEEIRPAPDGDNVPMALIIDTQYRGEHSFADYLRLFVGPFLGQINVAVLVLVVAGALGYIIARFLDRSVANPLKPRMMSRRLATYLLIALPVIMFGLVYGVGSILPLTDTRRWGGLLLTIMLTLVGIVASFPLGIGLALGRRSSLPVISAASTLYIEFVRGVPLITVLFMTQLLLPLISPTLAEMPNVFRAMIAITLFSAAYLAENVRGGLQSIPPGQEEAAKALGLNGLQITMNITLPQALRAILPALVGMVISLFKDTSLVAIVGLLDLTGMAQNIVSQTEFIGLRRETIIFITLIYFVVSYAIAAVARRIEESGAGAAQSRKI
jgi:His/Glu/Gln/Arg/opine family amino acid ABC transporter permease subunit